MGGPPESAFDANLKELRPGLVVAAALLIAYVVTLAPGVTYWDSGEFLAAIKTLGIPHPPGTPLFVLIAHAWGLLLPLGEYAVRTNLLSAIFSAAGGTHDDWDEYDRVMAEQRRTVVLVAPTRVYSNG